MADFTTVQDGPLLDPDTWGGTLPGEFDSMEIAHDCTLGDGDAVQYASVLIATGSLAASGACSLSADITITGTSTVGTAQGVVLVTGTLTITGNVNCGCGGLVANLICVGESATLAVHGNVICAADGGALYSYGALIAVTGDVTVSSGNGCSWVSGGSITINGDVSLGYGLAIAAALATDGSGILTINGTLTTDVILILPETVVGTFPAGNSVLAGTMYGVGGNMAGNYFANCITAGNVASGVHFGIGNASVGTLVAGNGTYPLGNQVLNNIAFGPHGNDYLGNVTLPSANGTLTSEHYGASGALQGNWYAEGLTPGNVKNNVHYGIGNQTVGTLAGDSGNGTSDWSAAEKAQIRYRLGLDGAVAVPGNVTPTMPLGPTERNAIADATLARSAANVEAYADPHSLCFSVLALGHASSTLSPGNLVVYRTDGQTEFARRAIRSDPGATPITEIDG